MASVSHIFNRSGPIHLTHPTHIDWQNPHHRRSVAAALVQGVYVLEFDRQDKRLGQSALAPPWWENFHFHLNQRLEDDEDLTVFGAIYEYKYPNSNFTSPHYIIAFRGTLITRDTLAQDIKLDLRCAFNSLQNSSRFQLALLAVQKIIYTARPLNVWLAGHSLGSAISLLVGWYMVKMGYYLETYLFNLPIIDGLMGLIKVVFRIPVCIIKDKVATLFKYHDSNKSKENEPFEVLSSWIPYVFLNPRDIISLKYIKYFEKMESIGYGQNSFVSKVSGGESEPLHFIPSAYLTINLRPTEGFKQDHGVEQWWSADLVSHSKLHRQFLK